MDGLSTSKGVVRDQLGWVGTQHIPRLWLRQKVKIRAVQTLYSQAHDHSSRGEGFLWASSTQEDAKI